MEKMFFKFRGASVMLTDIGYIDSQEAYCVFAEVTIGKNTVEEWFNGNLSIESARYALGFVGRNILGRIPFNKGRRGAFGRNIFGRDTRKKYSRR